MSWLFKFFRALGEFFSLILPELSRQAKAPKPVIFAGGDPEVIADVDKSLRAAIASGHDIDTIVCNECGREIPNDKSINDLDDVILCEKDGEHGQYVRVSCTFQFPDGHWCAGDFRIKVRSGNVIDGGDGDE